MNLIASTCDAATSQYGEKVASCLPMTGYELLIILVLGLLALGVGIYLRVKNVDVVNSEDDPTEDTDRFGPNGRSV